jgi:uroporphyrin-3 C-methyltransferase
MAAKVSLLEVRLAETAIQRSQFEDLLQSLARSRDENVLADMEAALRVAQQQSAITGSAEPLLQVLRQADERLARYAQPRLERVRRAVAQDLERTRAAGIVDVSTLAIRLDEVARQVDELPLLVQPPQAGAGRRGGAGGDSGAGAGAGPAASRPVASAAVQAAALPASASASAAPSRPGDLQSPLEALRLGWNRFTAHLWAETRGLVRITPIANPEAILLAPEQAWYLRENLKLKLLNARLALLSRQFDTAQSDLRDVQATIDRNFDRSARRTVLAQEALKLVAAQARTVVVPRPDATLAAIATAAAGR